MKHLIIILSVFILFSCPDNPIYPDYHRDYRITAQSFTQLALNVRMIDFVCYSEVRNNYTFSSSFIGVHYETNILTNWYTHVTNVKQVTTYHYYEITFTNAYLNTVTNSYIMTNYGRGYPLITSDRRF